MTLPKYVNILGFRYRVYCNAGPKAKKALKTERGIEGGQLGHVYHLASEIYINPYQSEREKFLTLLHESMHCINYHLFMGKLLTKHKDDEIVLDQMATALMSFIQSNRGLCQKIGKLRNL